MATSPDSTTVESRSVYWRRVLRPLFWWLLLVLGLFALHQHQLAMERTRLRFSVVLQGNDVGVHTAVKLDGQTEMSGPMVSGQKISLGNHTLTVIHPKAEPFTTNFFVWYGGLDFGPINLKRAAGSLQVTANPSAPLITINGPEFSLTLHDSGGTNLTVPTDGYVIQAQYPHWAQTQNPSVFDRQSTACVFSPKFGVLHLTCNREEATYQLKTADGQAVASGNLPVTVNDLPSDRYQAIITYHNRQLQKDFFLKAGVTNEMPIEFLLGTARLESDPPGAMIQDAMGRNLGQTPLDLADMPVQTTRFNLSLPGYQSTSVNLDIVANQTTTNRTRLISVAYFAAMDVAKRNLNAGHYEQALSAVRQALEANPGDTTALSLQREAGGRLQLQTAKQKATQGDYIEAVRILEPAIRMLADNEAAKTLLAEYKQQVPAQIERLHQERLMVPQMALVQVLPAFSFNNEGSFFDSHELITSKPFAELEPALRVAFAQTLPFYKITRKELSWPDSFSMGCQLELPGGLRKVVITGAKINETESRIRFKVMEYITKHSVSFEGKLTFNTGFIPLHVPEVSGLTDKMTAQIQEGMRDTKERIQKAIGQ